MLGTCNLLRDDTVRTGYLAVLHFPVADSTRRLKALSKSLIQVKMGLESILVCNRVLS